MQKKRCVIHTTRYAFWFSLFLFLVKSLCSKFIPYRLLNIPCVMKFEFLLISVIVNKYFSLYLCFNNLLLILQNGDSKQAIEICSEAIEISPRTAHTFCDRAEAYLLDDMFDEGMSF